MINLENLDYQLKNTTCLFVSFKNNRFYFESDYQIKPYKIRGYIYLETLRDNETNKKEVSEVYRYGVYKIKDFDGYKITNIETGEIFEQVRWGE